MTFVEKLIVEHDSLLREMRRRKKNHITNEELKGANRELKDLFFICVSMPAITLVNGKYELSIRPHNTPGRPFDQIINYIRANSLGTAQLKEEEIITGSHPIVDFFKSRLASVPKGKTEAHFFSIPGGRKYKVIFNEVAEAGNHPSQRLEFHYKPIFGKERRVAKLYWGSPEKYSTRYSADLCFYDQKLMPELLQFLFEGERYKKGKIRSLSKKV